MLEGQLVRAAGYKLGVRERDKTGRDLPRNAPFRRETCAAKTAPHCSPQHFSSTAALQREPGAGGSAVLIVP